MTFAIMFAAAVAAATPAAPERMPCAGAAYRQLDFWIGDWNVFQASDNTKVGTSRIESVMGGCGIAEHFEASDAPGGAYSGTSYSGYDREDGITRMIYRHLKDGSVEQIGSVSTNFGRAWKTRYDYIYRKK
jgi:hypothetical protein